MRRALCHWIVLLCAGPWSAAVHSGPTTATVYRCAVGDQITFSDRPCGAGAQIYEPDTSRVSTYDPPAPAASGARPAAKRDRPRISNGSIEAARAKKKAECSRWRAELKALRDKMRAGYRSKEGERLRERQSRLQSQLRAARCS